MIVSCQYRMDILCDFKYQILNIAVLLIIDGKIMPHYCILYLQCDYTKDLQSLIEKCTLFSFKFFQLLAVGLDENH